VVAALKTILLILVLAVIPAQADPDEGWVQITFDWAAMQPDGPDDLIAPEIDADGRAIVGLIVHTPAWASESGQPEAVPAGVALPIRDPGNVWAAFVMKLARHYPDIHHWIIYDEPNVQRGEGVVQFAGTVADYALLLKVAAQAARRVDAEAVMHVAAANRDVDAAAGRDPYLARLLAELGTASATAFDVVTLRVFNSTQAVEEAISETRALLDGAGLADKTIWLEANAQTDDPLFDITPEQQSDFVIQAAALSLALGVEHFTVYQPDEQALTTYRMISDLFGPTISASRYTQDGAEMIVMQQADREIYVMWAQRETPVQFQITTGAVGNEADLYTAPQTHRVLRSTADEYPAAFVIDAPAAVRDARGFLNVAGAPRLLVLDRNDEFFRVIYAVIGGERLRLK